MNRIESDWPELSANELEQVRGGVAQNEEVERPAPSSPDHIVHSSDDIPRVSTARWLPRSVWSHPTGNR